MTIARAVWVILLDISGSMDDGFSGAPTTDPMAERGRWRTKLDAAKELLVRQVAAARVQDIAVFVFADRAEKIYQGSRLDFSQAEARILSLQTGNMTNLAGGLLAVTNDKDLEPYKALSVLILSDGLSNVGNPAAAAEELIQKFPFARIDTILIDETVEGGKIAEEVSIGGSVRPAFSILALEDEMQAARSNSLRQELAGFADRRMQIQSELALMGTIGGPTMLTVTTPLDLTAASLRDEIVPTLRGLELIEQAVNEISGRQYLGAISSISQESPVSISLTGLKEAVELALELVIPWRIRHAKLMAKLKEEQIENENEKARIENEKMRVALAAEKIALAKQMYEMYDPNFTKGDRHRQRLMQQFVNGIDQLSIGSMEFKVTGPHPGDGKRHTTMRQ